MNFQWFLLQINPGIGKMVKNVINVTVNVSTNCMRLTIYENHIYRVSAVRKGNLAQFNQVLENHGEKFQAEDTYVLIIRLRHNVIKTGNVAFDIIQEV